MKHCNKFVGLEVHQDTIAVAVSEADGGYRQLNEWHEKDGGFAERYPRLLSAYRFLPNMKRRSPQHAIINCLYEMAAERHSSGQTSGTIGERIRK